MQFRHIILCPTIFIFTLVFFSMVDAMEFREFQDDDESKAPNPLHQVEDAPSPPTPQCFHKYNDRFRSMLLMKERNQYMSKNLSEGEQEFTVDFRDAINGTYVGVTIRYKNHVDIFTRPQQTDFTVHTDDDTVWKCERGGVRIETLWDLFNAQLEARILSDKQLLNQGLKMFEPTNGQRLKMFESRKGLVELMKRQGFTIEPKPRACVQSKFSVTEEQPGSLATHDHCSRNLEAKTENLQQQMVGMVELVRKLSERMDSLEVRPNPLAPSSVKNSHLERAEGHTEPTMIGEGSWTGTENGTDPATELSSNNGSNSEFPSPGLVDATPGLTNTPGKETDNHNGVPQPSAPRIPDAPPAFNPSISASPDSPGSPENAPVAKPSPLQDDSSTDSDSRSYGTAMYTF